MIAYDLHCSEGHAFEGWFDNESSYSDQLERGLISCPACGSTDVRRVMSTFGVVKKRAAPARDQASPEGLIRQAAKFFQDHFEDVGAEFANEAVKMHYGVVEHRNIRGVSSEPEEEMLKKEGVPFFKFPAPSDDK